MHKRLPLNYINYDGAEIDYGGVKVKPGSPTSAYNQRLNSNTTNDSLV